MPTATLFNDIEVARTYAQHRGVVDRAFLAEVARSLGTRDGVVADVGAGTGAPAAELVRRGYDVVAIESSPAMIANRRAGVRFVQGDAESLPLRDGSCDGVVLLYVLHHTEDPEIALSEARRVLAPGGRVVVASGANGCARQRLFAGYFPTLAPDLPDADEIGVYARAAGLHVTDVRTVDYWVYPQRTVDAAYVRMVSTEMFAVLRSLNADEFDAGLARLRSDLGRPLPPAQVSLLSLERYRSGPVGGSAVRPSASLDGHAPTAALLPLRTGDPAPDLVGRPRHWHVRSVTSPETTSSAAGAKGSTGPSGPSAGDAGAASSRASRCRS